MLARHMPLGVCASASSSPAQAASIVSLQLAPGSSCQRTVDALKIEPRRFACAHHAHTCSAFPRGGPHGPHGTCVPPGQDRSSERLGKGPDVFLQRRGRGCRYHVAYPASCDVGVTRCVRPCPGPGNPIHNYIYGNIILNVTAIVHKLAMVAFYYPDSNVRHAHTQDYDRRRRRCHTLPHLYS